ncbi:MAG TPA: ABC transporter permease [Solirubrobacteraceae bacterium]|jgi:peptide/nickel transport system permease protein|nr:ABC transporter permease [Solirubrobacteraceae bacterium]
MAVYIATRVVRAIVLLIAVSIVSFVLFTALSDANPAPGASSGNFFDYLNAVLLHFNFGYSARNHQSVLSLVVGRLPASLSLIAGAGLLAVAAAIPVGLVAAMRPGTRFERIAMRTTLGLVSMPAFWLGLIVLYLFASDIGKIPIFPGAGSYVGLTVNPGRWFTSLILPWLVLAAIEAAIYTRLVRGQLRAVMDEDYIASARARGVAEPRVVWRHGAAAALAALVAVLGLDLGGLIGGAVLTETVFRIHGIGLLGYDAVLHSDYATVQGMVLLAAMFIVVMNLIVDIGFAWLDPRVSVA